MKITEAQIERYFNNECDAKERQAISDYFIRHPELLAKYLTEQSWENFEPEHSLQQALSKKILSAIRTKTYAARRRMIIHRNWAAAAAACAGQQVWALYGSRNSTTRNQLQHRCCNNAATSC